MSSLTTAQIVSQPGRLLPESLPAITACIELLGDARSSSEYRNQIQSAIDLDDTTSLAALYHQVIADLETLLWATEPMQHLDLYQELFRELEDLIALQPEDNRHHITIVIPVADRPGQLTDCINSLVSQCRLFNYGGSTDNQTNKISVIVADDSNNSQCIEETKQLCEQTNNQGLSTTYIGRDEQDQVLDELSEKQKADLKNLLGNVDADRTHHKGPSVIRNLCYLYLNKHFHKLDNHIFYFIDSDQLFSVNPKDSNIQAINYFYYLDRIFFESDAKLVTGKVVGDPPVSPAVMANTLLSDVISLLQDLSRLPSSSQCQFHHHSTSSSDDATYHDMADLFGFSSNNNEHQYDCPLHGKHSNQDCLIDFCERLGHFFYGDHPTRSTPFQYLNPLQSVAPARTVYTGNYAFKSNALPYFIPFSNLRLRMAGPTLGRILKSTTDSGFVSANLPMLHKRTFGNTGMAECRPGVTKDDNKIDLSQEYVRQYFGDVMLFSVERLTSMGFPTVTPDENMIMTIVQEVETDLYKKYQDKGNLVIQKLDDLKAFIRLATSKSDHEIFPDVSIQKLEEFIRNMTFNFGPDSSGFKKISDKQIRENHLSSIASAISIYRTDLHNWTDTLSLTQ